MRQRNACICLCLRLGFVSKYLWKLRTSERFFREYLKLNAQRLVKDIRLILGDSTADLEPQFSYRVKH